MLKFAFILNAEGETPESYKTVYENEESRAVITATSTYDMTEKLAMDLKKDGFTMIDLCGDFDDEAVEKLTKATDGSIKIRHAGYLPEELKKIEALESLKEYGIILKLDGIEETEALEIEGASCNAHIRIVKDLEAAQAAAGKLADEGAYFIELCSWFDRERTEAVISAIDGRIPVGACGDLS